MGLVLSAVFLKRMQCLSRCCVALFVVLMAAPAAWAQALLELPAVPGKSIESNVVTEFVNLASPKDSAEKFNATGVSLEGNAGYVLSGGTARLKADYVVNRRSFGTSGTLKLELWALPTPYAGSGATGYKLAQTTLGTLPSGYYFYGIDRTVTQLSVPTNGTWYLTMFVTEYAAVSSNSGYVPVDWGNFPTPWVIGAASNKVTVYELTNSLTGHYFRTASADEVAAIAAGSAGPGWTRTMDDFVAYAAQSSGAGYDVCRFYSATSNSHFYTAIADECAGLKAVVGEWAYEGLSFRIPLPVSGNCGAGQKLVYRLYNNRYMYKDSNHRFTTSASEVARMSASGWQYEGAAFCALE